MRRTSIKTRFIVPLLALIMAFAFAPAAFAGNYTAGTMAEGDDPATEGDDQGGVVEITTFGPGQAIENAEIRFNPGQSLVYNGQQIKPTFTVWLDINGDGVKEQLTEGEVEGTGYRVFYKDNVTAGAAYAYAWCQDTEHMYIKEQAFTISPAPISAATIKIADKVYNGKKQTPPPTITYKNMRLKQGTDFTVTYSKNKKVGTAKAIIKGKGNYGGKVTKTFKIKRASIANAKMTNLKPKTYTGKKITPKVTVKYKGKKLKVNKDYTVKYKNNKNVGIASVVVKGTGNLKGKRVLEFAIKPAPISKCKISYKESWYWNGTIMKPSPTVKYKGKTLKNGKDYLVDWSNNTNVGTGKIYITGKGNFSGTYKGNFTINLLPLTNSIVSTTPKTGTIYSYTPETKVPKPTVRLTVNGKKYIISDSYYSLYYYDNTKWYYSYDEALASGSFKGDTAKDKTYIIRVQAKDGSNYFTGYRDIAYTIKKPADDQPVG